MLLFSFAVGKVKIIYQCVTFHLFNVLGHSFNSLYGCPSISVRPQGKYTFGISFPFSCLIRLQLFFRSSTPFLPAKRFIRRTGKSSSDMSDASSTQDLCKIFSLPSPESLVWSSFSESLSRKFPQGLASNFKVTPMTETEFLHLQRR